MSRLGKLMGVAIKNAGLVRLKLYVTPENAAKIKRISIQDKPLYLQALRDAEEQYMFEQMESNSSKIDENS